MGMAASGGGMSGVPTGYSVCTSGANSAEHYFERLRASRKKNQRPKKNITQGKLRTSCSVCLNHGMQQLS